MKNTHMLRYMAFFTLGAGMIFLARVVQAVLAEVAVEEKQMLVLTTIILATAAAISIGIISSTIVHLRKPSSDSALRLAQTASASVFFLWPSFAGLIGSTGPTAASSGAGLVIAFLLYRFVLRPAALKAARERI